MKFGNWPGLGRDVAKTVKELTEQHPYYPKLVSLPGYRYQSLDYAHILVPFAIATLVVGLAAFVLSGRRKGLSLLDRSVLTWWTITGLIHVLVEGYVVSVPSFYKDNKGMYLSEAWVMLFEGKEYAKADSRYATRDSFVICMEGFTAFVEGPLCFVIVYALAYRKPWRHVLQVLVAFGQLYGTILYYLTTWYEGMVHSRPEAMYFWGYFVALNFVWVLVPGLIIFRNAKQISAAVASHDRYSSIASRITSIDYSLMESKLIAQ